VCPHRGGPIADGQIDDRVVLCPLHLNAFDLTTGCSITGAAPLRSYPVESAGGDIVVTVAG
jgi:nitrite reductase (NADH) small subunit